MKKFLSLIVVALMLVSILPLAAFAAVDPVIIDVENSTWELKDTDAKAGDAAKVELTLYGEVTDNGKATLGVLTNKGVAKIEFSTDDKTYNDMTVGTSGENHDYYYAEISFGAGELVKDVYVKITYGKPGSVKAVFLAKTGDNFAYNNYAKWAKAESYEKELVTIGKECVISYGAADIDDVTISVESTKKNASGEDVPVHANGIETFTIKAKVLDDNDYPVVGEKVTFSLLGVGGVLTETTAETNNKGVAETKLYSTKPGTIKVKATAGKEDSGYVDAIFASTGVATIKADSDNNQKIARGNYADVEFKIKGFDASGNEVVLTDEIEDVKVTAEPSGSDIEEDLSLTYEGGVAVITLDPEDLEKDGDYEFKAYLVNGSSVTYNFSAKELGDIVAMSLDYETASVAKGSTTGEPSVKYLDADGYSRTASATEVQNLTFTVSDASIATFDGTKGKVKGLEEGVVTVTAIDEEDELVASATLTVGKAASALKLTAPAAAAANEEAKVAVQLVDGNGNPVVNFTTDSVSGKGFITSKPENALVTDVTVDTGDFAKKGQATAKFTAYTEGTYTVQVVIGSYTGSATVVVGPANIDAGNVVFMIGATSYVSAGQAYAGTSVPFVDANNRTMLGFRDLGAALGATVSYENGVATLTKAGKVVTAKAGDKFLTVDGKQVAIDTEIVNVEGRLFLPLRAVSTAFGYDVNYSNGVIVLK